MRLDGKVTIVTGGATGIGAGICEGFVAEGARVVIASRNRERGGAAAARLGCDYEPTDAGHPLLILSGRRVPPRNAFEVRGPRGYGHPREPVYRHGTTEDRTSPQARTTGSSTHSSIISHTRSLRAGQPS
jgi:hypothetical protein